MILGVTHICGTEVSVWHNCLQADAGGTGGIYFHEHRNMRSHKYNADDFPGLIVFEC